MRHKIFSRDSCIKRLNHDYHAEKAQLETLSKSLETIRAKEADAIHVIEEEVEAVKKALKEVSELNEAEKINALDADKGRLPTSYYLIPKNISVDLM